MECDTFSAVHILSLVLKTSERVKGDITLCYSDLIDNRSMDRAEPDVLWDGVKALGMYWLQWDFSCKTTEASSSLKCGLTQMFPVRIQLKEVPEE